MSSFAKGLKTFALAGALAAAGFVGVDLFKDAQFARAQQEVQATREQLANVEDLAKVFREVGKVVEPSVVNINVRKHAAGHARMPFNEEQLRRFFPDRDGDGQPDVPPELQDQEGGIVMGTGSGVIMETDGSVGYILTNNHVAGDAEELTVTLADGRTIEDAKLLGADPKTDLAVVKIESDHLMAAKWGDSDKLDRGDWIMAFGSPFGYIGSMTHGIVSALNRNNVGILGAGGYENFIQVDAPINPGNSGGPLVNIRGEVVGINTAIATRSGGFQGIGFAIPSNQAKFVYNQLKDKGKVSRGWLGVSISDLASPRGQGIAKSFGFESAEGVLVEDVFPGTPAYGHLQPGDIITQFNDKPVKDMQQLRNHVAATAAGTEVKLNVFRDKKDQSVKLKLGEQPEDVMAAAQGNGDRANPDRGDATKANDLGVTLESVTPKTGERLGMPNAPAAGAIITAIERRSPAAKAGLRVGDIITRVDDQVVKTAAEADAAMSKADLTKGVRLYLTGREGSRFVLIRGK